MSVALSAPSELLDALCTHLAEGDPEQVAFVYTEPHDSTGRIRLSELYPVPPTGFEFQSDFHVTLTDEERAHVIGRAWELGGCLVEAHSHRVGVPPEFSGSDIAGFSDWVPHVRWRLRGRPYVALVFDGGAFDALAWHTEDGRASAVSTIDVDGREPLHPTGRTLARRGPDLRGR